MDQAKLDFICKDYVHLMNGLPAETKGKFGKMNMQQVVEHLSDVFKISSGKLKLNLVTPVEHLPRYMDFLYSDKEFRENTKAPANILPEEPAVVRLASIGEALLRRWVFGEEARCNTATPITPNGSLSTLGHSNPCKPQIARLSPLAHGLLLIARLGPVGGANAPIVGALGRPAEFRRRLQRHQHRPRVIADVGTKAQLGAGLHRAGEQRQGRRVHQPALTVLGLRPGVRKQNECPVDRGRRQPAQHRTGVVRIKPDIAQVLLLDGGQHLDHPLLERLAADATGVRVVLRLPDQVLAAAEADLEPDLRFRRIEQASEFGGGRRRQIEPDARQHLADQPFLPRRQLATAPAAIGPQVEMIVLTVLMIQGRALKARRRASVLARLAADLLRSGLRRSGASGYHIRRRTVPKSLVPRA